MNADLRHIYKNGLDDLLKWRNRYTKEEYPEKVVINIFYRKYTMEFIWDNIISCFEKDSLGKPIIKWNDFNQGYRYLYSIYEKTSVTKTHIILPELLKQTNREVGTQKYDNLIPLIYKAKNGDNSQLAEIEYVYFYYLLADDSIILWGALGGTGSSKIDSIGRLTGLLFETQDINTYAHIEQILGPYCAAAYLKEHFNPLPPLL